jgi:uncharacterized protein with PIN domain
LHIANGIAGLRSIRQTVADKDSTPSDADGGNADCVIPEAASSEALERYSLKASAYDGADEIRSYVEGQSREERVTYLERISAERVIGNDHEVWDVHTTGERYWVITRPTNLYAQRLFPSADYTLTFHVGLSARVASRREVADTEQRERLAGPWRRWVQAAEALDQAREAEEFQSVGMRCRECLLSLVKEISSATMVPPGTEAPKAADFIHWSELIANALAGGGSAKEIRAYLKTSAQAAWQLVSWLTHATNADRFQGEIGVEATESVLVAFSTALLRFERGTPDRCPECGSYKLETRYMPELSASIPYATLCVACGWTNAELEDVKS